MDVLYKKFPAPLQKQIWFVLNLIILISLIYLLPVSWKFFWFMKNVSAPTMKISWGFLFFSAPLSILLMTIHTLMGLIHAMRQGEDKKTLAPR